MRESSATTCNLTEMCPAQHSYSHTHPYSTPERPPPNHNLLPNRLKPQMQIHPPRRRRTLQENMRRRNFRISLPNRPIHQLPPHASPLPLGPHHQRRQVPVLRVAHDFCSALVAFGNVCVPGYFVDAGPYLAYVCVAPVHFGLQVVVGEGAAAEVVVDAWVGGMHPAGYAHGGVSGVVYGFDPVDGGDGEGG